MITKRSPHKSTRIGQAHTLFGAFKRRHGPKPAMVCVLAGAATFRAEIRDERYQTN
jgi:hypothetical protein